MTQTKSQLQKINTVLNLLTDVNLILAHAATQNDRLQKMQYERQKQHYLAQLTELLGESTQPLAIMAKRASKAA